MKKIIVLYAVALTALLLVIPITGCQRQSQPAATPSLAIMVESNVVEAGSSFAVWGSHFKPNQKVWVDLEYQASGRVACIGVYGQADEEGLISPIIEIPEDTSPGDYEVEVSTGENVYDREIIATLPIHISKPRCNEVDDA